MFSKKILISNREISISSYPFLIAEVSGNHNGSINRAKQLIKDAKIFGADAVKLQTYTADSLTLDSYREEFYLSEGLWRGKRLYDLYQEAHTPWEWHKELFAYAEKIGVILFSSPFDRAAVDLLEKLDAPAYKIASPEIIDHDLIDYVSKKKKPIIISTGMATLEEIDEALEICKFNNNREVILLHCSSAYPANIKESYLSNIDYLKNKYNILVGLSDHSIGTKVPALAVACGARVIEKHITLKKSDGGVDSDFSMESNELGQLREIIDEAFEISSDILFGPKPSETQSYKNRRSLYVSKSVKKGEAFTNDNVKCVRPANGLKPKYLKVVLQSSAKEDIAEFTPLNWEVIKTNDT